MRVAEQLQRWLANPVLAEWDEPVSWSDVVGRHSHEAFCELARVLAFRAAPLAVVLFAAGFWWIGRIPGGSGPVPVSKQLLVAVPLIGALAVPYLARALLRPKPGRKRRIRLCVRGPQVTANDRVAKTSPWSEFDAFAFGPWRDVHLLKLRLRGTWLSRRLAPRRVVAFGLDSADAAEGLRPILQDRGLHEEPLDDPLPASPRPLQP
jgi:hypothetical protein